MEELIFGSLIVWALGRITKKKAESAPQERSHRPGYPELALDHRTHGL
jgi:hypothetical protein